VLDNILIAISNTENGTGGTGRTAIPNILSPIGNVQNLGAAVGEAFGNLIEGSGIAEAIPKLADGGLILKRGIAIVDKGERFDGGKGFGSGTQLTINGGIFLDWAGFVNSVRQAGVELNVRSLA